MNYNDLGKGGLETFFTKFLYPICAECTMRTLPIIPLILLVRNLLIIKLYWLSNWGYVHF